MSKLKQTALWITLLAFFLKIMGFFRESMIAKEFGASDLTDGFLLSFGFVTLVLAMISNGFNSVFLPHYVKHRQQNLERAERNASGVLNFVIVFFILASAATYFLVPYLVDFIFNPESAVTERVTTEMTQIFFLFMVIIALSGVLESYLQARHSYVPTQISKIMGTIMATLFIVFFADLWGIYSVAYGFLFGTFLGVCIQFFYLFKNGFKWRFEFNLDKEFGKAFLVLLIPALLHSSVGHINLFVDKSFAAGTAGGPVTYLNNASLLMSIPPIIFQTTILAIVFTLLSEHAESKEKFSQTLFTGYQIAIMTLLPIAVGMYIVGEAAISFIYERQEFTPQDTANTVAALKMYIPFILTQGLLVTAVKGMYAKGEAKRIVKISSTTILLNIALNYVLERWLGYPGIALSTSLVNIYYSTIMTLAVYKGLGNGELRRLVTMFGRVILPTIVMAIPLVLLQQFTGIDEMYSLYELLILVPIGIVFYLAGMFVFYREGFNQIMRLVRERKNMQA
ncbi:murein biosynthesis integral membrane protein MurJ [Pontibacillus marinus]|uniref:Membrane protein n=1 Tax=Pontibacillus marinus BH030004 = DSM 16465 TaxID=1385511 RepID=A0A0A5GID7_9BACI|nr:murein biosynthesis integral membrane protein MurJ [Pontibacillus marinus]KGX90978.1 membrane protein [Pontibacillus marinus BH030004 = DSM 16465]